MSKILWLCNACLDLFANGGFKASPFGKSEKGQCDNCSTKNTFVQRVRIDGKNEANEQGNSRSFEGEIPTFK